MKLVIEFENTTELGEQMISLMASLGIIQENDPDAKADSVEQDTPAPVDQPGGEMTRPEIKTELDRLGIEYNSRCATPTLAALLAAELDKHPFVESGTASEESVPVETEAFDGPKTEAVEEDLNIFGAEEVPEVEETKPVHDKVAVRAALVDFIEKIGDGGQEKARAVLVKVAGVNSLRDLPEDKYDAVVQELRG